MQWLSAADAGAVPPNFVGYADPLQGRQQLRGAASGKAANLAALPVKVRASYFTVMQ